MRAKIAVGMLGFVFLAASGCSRKAEQSSSRTEPARAAVNEVEINLTEAQAQTGTDARVTIPESRETVSVKIPPGVRDGMRLRLKGKGAPNPDGTPGDFLIRLKVR